jgi:AcrR family transcriptional regulator
MKSTSEVGSTSDRQLRRRTRTRASLLEAAQEVLARLGYQATTVADITGAADVGVGTFYLYFRDKDAIVRTVLEEGLEELCATVGALVAPLPLAHSLPTAIRAICCALHAHRDIVRIAYTAGSFVDLTQQGQVVLADYLRRAIEAAQAEGIVGTEIEAPLAAHLISGMIIQGAMQWFDNSEPPPARMAAQIIRLLRGGLPVVLFAEDDAGNER